MKALPMIAGFAVALTCILVWELWPSTDDAPDITGPRTVPVHVPVDAEPDTDLLTDIAATLLERPLFSPNRRLAPTGFGSLGLAENLPRLSGIVTGPSGGTAIFDDGSGRAKAVAAGDSVGRFKIGDITPGQVSLIASEGGRVLRPNFAHLVGASSAPEVQSSGSVK